MSYLKFNKPELVNLEYSLQREILATNRTGGYCNTTIVGCNTRKYHGLFVLPLENFDDKRYVLLSGMDETLVQHDKEFNLGIRCYGDTFYEPRGHKYIIDFEADPECRTTYRVGGMIFSKSMLFVRNREQLLIKYTLEDAHSETTLRLKPFLAYRSIHALTHQNETADTTYIDIENGASFCMYQGFPRLNIQISRQNWFNPCPDWYKNVVYKEEKRRGFENQEDLFCPGCFELPIRKGESVVVSISTQPVMARSIAATYTKELKTRKPINDFKECLSLAADRFIVNQKGRKEIYNGYTWLAKGLRHTLVSLPGLTLFNRGDVKAFNEILADSIKAYQHPLMYGSRQVEAALWLTWTIQQYIDFTGDEEGAWKKYGSLLMKVIDSFISGERMGVHVSENGMLWAKMNGVAMTWMNAYDSDGNPVTERGGFQVEVNSLWYNAVAFAEAMCSKYGKNQHVLHQLREIRHKIDDNFLKLFWVEERHHLADYVDENGQNVFTRPNQIFTCALDYSPISEEVKAQIMHACKRELLTARGIRTLAPKNPLYQGIYDGDQNSRDHAFHQGSTRVWLLPFYLEARLKLYGAASVTHAIQMVNAFDEDLTIHGVGAISEVYDGDPPHHPHGAIASASATAGLLRAMYIISKYDKE